ncbi:MAG: NAD-dependent epimerase/dehydratase family protein [Dehalococcoidia bacterium]|nr:NAD-dependent epimerase/dehydratase family protein [Dehalococcoidia bacterium]
MSASETPSRKTGGPTRALVTGGTGFLGQAIVARLLARGDGVAVLARRASRIPPAWAGRVDVRYGDLTDVRSVAASLHDVDTVAHSAALVTYSGARRDDYLRVNVQGTENVLAAMTAAGVRRLLHVSSVAVYGVERDHRGANEAAPYGVQTLSPYAASKIEAERRVLDYGRRGLLAVSVARPGWIWGPGDGANVPRLMPFIRRGLVPLMGHGDNVLHLSYVENVAEGCVVALTSERAVGQVYNLTDGGSVTYRRFVGDLVQALGMRPRYVRIPFGAAYALAALMEGLYNVIPGGRLPPLTRWLVLNTVRHMEFDIAKARRELGYAPRVTYEDGMRQTTPWLRALAQGARAAEKEATST